MEFDASLSGPDDPTRLATLGTGYALVLRGRAKNGLPYGQSVQYDPPFAGLRTVALPDEANDDGHNPIASDPVNVQTGLEVHWVVRVAGKTAVVQVGNGPAVRIDLDRAAGVDDLDRRVTAHGANPV